MTQSCNGTHEFNGLGIVLCMAQLGLKALALAWLSRAPAWKKSKPGCQWGLKLGSAWLKARAAAWGESKGKGDSEGRHHNMGNRACCDVVPRQQHHVPG